MKHPIDQKVFSLKDNIEIGNFRDDVFLFREVEMFFPRLNKRY